MPRVLSEPPKGPLGNILVTIEFRNRGVTQCVADVTGIDNPETLYWGLIATLQEHNVLMGDKGFSDRNDNQLDAHQLFDLCHEHVNGDSDGPLRILVYRRRMCYLCGGYSDYFDRERLTPLKNVVAEVFSHHGHPICSVSLSGVAETWIFCDRIVTALQWQRFYVLPDYRTTTRIFSPEGHNLAELKNREFLAYFKNRPGNLKLTVEAYQARTAPRISKTPQQSPVPDEPKHPLGFSRTVFTLMSFRSKICTVNLIDVSDGQTIRRRIFDALKAYGYLVRLETPIQICDSYDPEAEYVLYLTDQALFDLCRERGDIDGSLQLFVEIPRAVHAPECPRPPEKEFPDLSVVIFDWRDLRRCCDVQVNRCGSGRDIYGMIQNALGLDNDFVVRDIHAENYCFSLQNDVLYDFFNNQTSREELKLYVFLCPRPKPRPKPTDVEFPSEYFIVFEDSVSKEEIDGHVAKLILAGGKIRCAWYRENKHVLRTALTATVPTSCLIMFHGLQADGRVKNFQSQELPPSDSDSEESELGTTHSESAGAFHEQRKKPKGASFWVSRMKSRLL